MEGYKKNQGFFGKVLEDDIFREQLEEYMGEHVYQLLSASKEQLNPEQPIKCK